MCLIIFLTDDYYKRARSATSGYSVFCELRERESSLVGGSWDHQCCVSERITLPNNSVHCLEALSFLDHHFQSEIFQG